MLDVPARLRVPRIWRPKYGCRVCVGGGTIHQAAAPKRPVAKGMASRGLLAHVLVSKYCDDGVEIARSTLANGVCRISVPRACNGGTVLEPRFACCET
jgi:transposase